MVCPRCIRVVREELEGLELPVIEVDMGEAGFARDISDDELAKVRQVLEQSGFELLDDRRQRLVEQLKLLIIDLVQSGGADKSAHENNSTSLARKLGHDYSFLRNLFFLSDNLQDSKGVVSGKRV